MESKPHDEPEVSRAEELQLRELMGAVTDMLPPLHAYVIELLYGGEGLSLRKAAVRVGRGKTTVARIRDEALETMRDLLTDNEEIQRRLQ